MKQILYLLIIISAFSACRPEEPVDDITNTTPIVTLPTDLVSGSISGIVTDNDGPLANSKVEIMGHTTHTDNDGAFSFENIELDKEGTLVRATATNYFEGSRVFYPNDSNDNFVHLKLHAPSVTGSIQSGNGGLFQIQQASVQLPSGRYKSQVDSYSGAITAKGLLLDPTSEDFSISMPGDLRGISENDQIVTLMPFSMLKVSLENDLGESLDLPAGTTAELNMPIPESMLGVADPMIPLYYYNETNGIWIQDGFAEKQDGFYVAVVDHFTYWSPALGFEVVEVSGQISIDGNLASYAEITLFDKASEFSISTILTQAGRYSLRVPHGLDLTMSIVGPCYGQTIEEPVGELPDLENVFDHDFTSEEGSIEISGHILDCDTSNPITNAFARIVHNGIYSIANVDGDGFFEASLIGCSPSDVKIFAIDLDDSKISSAQIHNASPTIDVGIIQPCTDVTPGLKIDYADKNWDFGDDVLHEWSISYITTGGVNNPKTVVIVSPTIKNRMTPSIVYMSGAFVFTEGATEVDYLLDFEADGFKAAGTFEVHGLQHDEELTSYRFIGKSTEITGIGNTIPTITEVDIDLVYYD